MNYLFLLTTFIIGLSGLVAQVLILRELLISYCGNELTLGIILANWVLWEAMGSLLIGKYIETLKNKINIFILLQLVFSLSLPLAIYLSRVFKGLLGIPFGEAIGLCTIFLSSFFIVMPLSFCHGGLFSASCKLYSLNSDEPNSIGKIYAWETIGTIIGGIILTYFFIPYLNSFQIIFIISLSSLITCLFFFGYKVNSILKYLSTAIVVILIYLFISGGFEYAQQFSIKRQWNMGKVLDYQNSNYGNIVLIKKEKQLTFFYNGIPTITTPYPDTPSVEEFGNLPLLFHPEPKDILIISGGAGGILNEILKHPVKKVDYLELDSSVITILNKYPTTLTKAELSDKRVNIIISDGRLFLRNTLNKYDIILIGTSRPSDLTTNRLFTQEFFLLAKHSLKPGGIMTFRLPGSLTYLSKEIRDLNFCVLNGLRSVYDYVCVLPGENNLYIASSSKGILELDPILISKRIVQQNIKTKILTPDYLSYRLDKHWIEWFMHSSRGATDKTNKDLLPFAVFEMLIFWNKQFSPKLAYFLESFQYLDLKIIFISIFMLILVFFYLFHRRPNLARLNIAYCIATTGFFGMLMSLVLIFIFQVFYGYIYRSIGILISLFMAGIALGSIFMTRRIGNIKDDYRLFINLEIAIIVFSYLTALTTAKLIGHMYYSYLIFIVLFFVPGFLMGLEFPLASKIYLRKNIEVGQTAGLLYCSDLIGGWIAGIFAGIIFFPILGLFKTCMVIAVLKLSSLILLMATKKIT